MPISGIGNQKALPESGYTLIEILAVLVILSVIGLLAFPRYARGEEKAYLKQIGNLIRADLRTVSEESVCEKSEISVVFFTNGYRFDIGDREIRRVFDKFQFRWDVSVEELGEAAEEAVVETLGLPGEEEETVNYGSIELSFSSDGSYPDLRVNWSSQNYTGNLIIESDGSVDWILSH